MTPSKHPTVQANIGSFISTCQNHTTPTIIERVDRNSQCAKSGIVVSGCDGRPDGWTVGVKLATALRLGAVCEAADLLRLVVNLLDRLRVGRLGHGFCFLIDPVANERIVPTGLFQQLYDLRRLLLAQDG